MEIRSKRLCVEVCSPDEPQSDTLRFDRAGFVSEVVLDGRIRFCASEPHILSHPSSGGRGLCSELVFDVSNDAQISEYFPKFGVGLIRKPDDKPYIFHRKYEDVQRFEVSYAAEKDSVTFTTLPSAPCMGYALGMTKTLSVEENRLTMTMRATNAGQKTLTLGEYCHNFLSIDGMAIGPRYTLDIPGLADQGTRAIEDDEWGGPTAFVGNGHGLTFRCYADKASYVAFDREMLCDRAAPFVWRLTNSGAKAFVECSEGFSPSKVCVWAVDHMVSPEVFFECTLAPGESAEWSRQWEFEQLR